MLSGTLSWSLYLVLLSSPHVQAFDATPRWGQAVALFNDSLFVYGGKTDHFNSFSYTSAPNTNDLLYLPLTNTFSTESTPWTLVSNSTTSSSPQGPSLAWHTLSPANPSNLLLFGGDPDPNSPTVVTSAADSAELLNIASPLNPVWSPEPTSWAGEPVRRMRHSTATSSSGQVFVIGGEKADGSGSAFSDHFVFNPTVPSFTSLPSNGPPDIYGHVSIMLSDGRLLVFGGYSSSQATLLPFSTIWVLNTSRSTLAWTVINTSTNSLPSPRMAFAAAALDGKIFIHGGSDENLQTNFADGWMLDTSQSTMVWTQVEALSQLGALRDHFAAGQGDLILFGFGYENDGPAPAPLQIFNSSSGSFVSLFTPLPPTQTSSTNSQTGKSTSPTSRPPGSASSSTTTANPNNHSGNSSDSSSNETRTVAIGATVGALALIVVLIGTGYYLRQRRQQGQGDRRFILLGGDERGDGADSPHFDGQIPAVSIRGDTVNGGNHGFLSSLGLSGVIGITTKMRNVRNYQRRDMLADEDTRSFGEWYSSRRRDGTGGSSWSLKSILGNRLVSREASGTSHSTPAGEINTPWREKSDPFADGTSLLRDEEADYIGATVGVPTRSRANGRRQISHTSSMSGLSYRDPFSDPIQEERRQRSDANNPLEEEQEVEIYDPLRLSVRHVPTLPPLVTTLPLTKGGPTLSPLSEHTSQHTPTIPESSTPVSSHVHSSETVLNPLSGSSSTIIGGVRDDIRRSDSWWTRFARTSFLDRKSSNTSRTSGKFEIRDPNPPPRLDAIAENINLMSGIDKNSRASQERRLLPPYQQNPILTKVASRMYDTGHGKSMSSLRTADSEAIERMAGTMDVFQRIKTRSDSRRTTGSISSGDGMSIDTRRSSSNTGYDNYVSGGGTNQAEQRVSPDHDLMALSSPVEILPLGVYGASSTSAEPSAPENSPPQLSSPPLPSKVSQSPKAPSSPGDGSIRTIGSLPPIPSQSISILPTSPSVAHRIQAFERQSSVERTFPPPATNTKYREERTKKRVTVDYGLIPRASLFIANPDSHRLSTTSGDSGS